MTAPDAGWRREKLAELVERLLSGDLDRETGELTLTAIGLAMVEPTKPLPPATASKPANAGEPERMAPEQRQKLRETVEALAALDRARRPQKTKRSMAPASLANLERAARLASPVSRPESPRWRQNAQMCRLSPVELAK
jgi:hypothetical protein